MKNFSLKKIKKSLLRWLLVLKYIWDCVIAYTFTIRIRKRYVFIYSHKMGYQSDLHYDYLGFAFLPFLNCHLRRYLGGRFNPHEFDYIQLSFGWLIFFVDLCYQKNQ